MLTIKMMALKIQSPSQNHLHNSKTITIFALANSKEHYSQAMHIAICRLTFWRDGRVVDCGGLENR